MDESVVDQMTIRPARTEDMAAVGEMWLQLVQYHQQLSADMPAAAPDSALLYARRLSNRLHDTHTRILVAEQDGRLRGYAFGVIVDMMPDVFAAETAGFLADIFVEPQCRGRGIGRALVKGLADWFRERGVAYFEWYTASSNHDGQAFWQALGGRAVITRMRLDLNGEPK